MHCGVPDQNKSFQIDFEKDKQKFHIMKVQTDRSQPYWGVAILEILVILLYKKKRFQKPLLGFFKNHSPVEIHLNKLHEA